MFFSHGFRHNGATHLRVTPTATAFDPSIDSSRRGATGLVSWYAEGFSDRLGDRLLLFDNSGPGLELLRFRAELSSRPGFEAALRSRVDRLTRFAHPAFARLRSVTVLDDPRPQLALASELPAGERLSALLRAVEHAGLRPAPSAALRLLRDVLRGLIALHQTGPGGVHGLITPDRIIVGPDASLTLTEQPLADAFRTLGLSSFELWRRFGVVVHPRGGPAAFDAADDVAQTALAAIAVLRGRVIDDEEEPTSMGMIEDATAGSALGRAMRSWLARALVPDRLAFASAADALAALEQAVSGVEAEWPSSLLPHALPPAPPRPGGADSTARAGLPESVVAVPALLAPVLGGATIPVRRLWMINAALAIVVCLEAAGLAVLMTRASAQPQISSAALPATPAPSAEPSAPSAISSGGDGTLTSPPATGPTSIPARNAAAAPDWLAPSATASGWIQLEGRVPLRMYSDGRFVGAGLRPRHRLPAGSHLITLVNEDKGIHVTAPVTIVAGQTVRLGPGTGRPGGSR